MALYLDTSALVKLYVEGDHRARATIAVTSIEAVVISVVGYAEARSALARRRNESRMDDEDHRQAVVELTQEWQTFVRIEVSESIALRAGELAELHALRGFDAIHLATALRSGEMFGDMLFLSFDDRLNAAAVKTGLTLCVDDHDGV